MVFSPLQCNCKFHFPWKHQTCGRTTGKPTKQSFTCIFHVIFPKSYICMQVQAIFATHTLNFCYFENSFHEIFNGNFNISRTSAYVGLAWLMSRACTYYVLCEFWTKNMYVIFFRWKLSNYSEMKNMWFLDLVKICKLPKNESLGM